MSSEAMALLDRIRDQSMLDGDNSMKLLGTSGGLYCVSQYMLNYDEPTVRRIACNIFSESIKYNPEL